jgi:hypothetical protein
MQGDDREGQGDAVILEVAVPRVQRCPRCPPTSPSGRLGCLRHGGDDQT